MSAAAWPPPPPLEDRWQDVRLRSGERLALRQVWLWGRLVLIDEAGRVWCPGCLDLVDVRALGEVGNPHRVGLPNRGSGQLRPMAGEPDRRRDRPEW